MGIFTRSIFSESVYINMVGGEQRKWVSQKVSHEVKVIEDKI